MKKHNFQTPNKEVRVFENPIELVNRAENKDSRDVEGYAFKYNVLSKRLYGYFRERVLPGALEGADMTDVKCYFNHDVNLILARTMSGTLNLNPDTVGLKYGFSSPDTTYGNNLLVSLDRGDVRHSSFAFMSEEVEWEEDPEFPDGEIRTIKKFKLIDDVSPVSNPAYMDSTALKRSFESIIEDRMKLRGATDSEVKDKIEQEQQLRSRELELAKAKIKIRR